jgi:hypothetical protein
VILMLGGTQADSCVTLRNGSGAIDNVAGTACADVGTAFTRHVELSSDIERMSPNMVESDVFRRWYWAIGRGSERRSMVVGPY